MRLIKKFGSGNRFGNGIKTTWNGYIKVYMPIHPYTDALGYVMLHRLIKEKELGRFLEAAEEIHHINGNKLDNRSENLFLTNKGKHTSNHHRKYEVIPCIFCSNDTWYVKPYFTKKYGIRMYRYCPTCKNGFITNK